jgi:rod shape-determining protein MreC
VTDRRILLLRTVLLWILLELLAAAQVRAPSGELVLWSWARTAVSPVVWAGETIGSLISDMITGISESGTLVATNRELRFELETARAIHQLMAEDVAALSELDGLSAGVPTFQASSIPARTTYRNLTQGRMVVRVEGGGRIAPDSPAVASGGVVGRVVRSDGHRCWIELITHPAAAVAIQTSDGLVQGLAVGGDTGELEIQFIPRQASLLRETELITSGADGIYPPGLPVGRVIAVRESADPFLEVRARPSADLATSRVVLLLVDWTDHQSLDGVVP